MTRFRSALPLLGLVAIAAVLRFQGLDRQSLWSDEAVTALLVRLDPRALLEGVARTESTPPLYYVVAWLWTRLAGTGEVGLRSLSALVGVLTVPVAFAAAGNLLGRRGALAAAVLVAFNPLLVWYAQEARAYSLLVLLCGLSFWAFTAVLAGRGSTAAAAWAVASALALCTHYFALFVVAVEAGWLVAARRERAVRLAAVGVGATALALLPLALHQRAGGQAGYIADTSLAGRVVTLGKQLVVGPDAPHDQAAAVVLALLAGVAVVALVVAGDNRLRRGALVAGGVAAGAIALSCIAALVGLDYVNTQNSLGVLVPLCTAIAAGLAVESRRFVGHLVLLAACATSAGLIVSVARDERFHRANWREALQIAVAGPPPGGRLLVIGPDYGGSFARGPALVYAPQAVSVDPLARTGPRFRSLVRPSDRSVPPNLPPAREVVFLLMGVSIDRKETARIAGPGAELVASTRSAGFEVLRYRLTGPRDDGVSRVPPTLGGVPVATLYVPVRPVTIASA